ncbi:MAG TPA: glucosaminidase domain-containing protein [Acidisarcina sp.]|nr:glucosaminidase domain-containing protein [Acidisarcina sp.]
MAFQQEAFLQKAAFAAHAAGHIFPEYAACEAALESAWGQSRLAIAANNLFGQKQLPSSSPVLQTISLPTREYLHGKWVTVNASWASFPDWNACFQARMHLLVAASRMYPHYAAALAATSGRQFVLEVSQTWSTDPARASKVLAIYDAHQACLGPSLRQA